MSWKERYLNQISCGDCADLLGHLPASSVDALITDPPYGIQFMGKDWDQALPSLQIWEECLRVLKPGAFAFVMCIPRFDCLSQMGARLNQAGFEIRFSPIFWTYASGFPKAANISKAVDKQLGAKRTVVAKYRHPRSIEQGKKEDKSWGIESLDNTLEGYTTQGDDKRTLEERLQVTAPATITAWAAYGGYGGFQPKPAVEVVIVAMKFLSEKTFVEQALKNQKGVTWLDDGRIPFMSEKDKMEEQSTRIGKSAKMGLGSWKGEKGYKDVNFDRSDRSHVKGRFPANLLVSDAVLDDNKLHKSGKMRIDTRLQAPEWSGQYSGLRNEGETYGDEGGFSRYFSLDAWWAERVKQLPENVQQTFPFLVVPKASKSEKDKGLEQLPLKNMRYQDRRGSSHECFEMEGSGRKTKTKGRNIHPTVKPIQLKSYLVTLGSRPEEIVLDPFIGTGTTGIACQLWNRHFIGFEIDPEYCKLAEARLKAFPRRLWHPEANPTGTQTPLTGWLN